MTYTVLCSSGAVWNLLRHGGSGARVAVPGMSEDADKGGLGPQFYVIYIIPYVSYRSYIPYIHHGYNYDYRGYYIVAGRL